MGVTHLCKNNDCSSTIRITKPHSYSNWEIRPTEEAENYANFNAIEINYCPFCGIRLTNLIKERCKNKNFLAIEAITKVLTEEYREKIVAISDLESCLLFITADDSLPEYTELFLWQFPYEKDEEISLSELTNYINDQKPFVFIYKTDLVKFLSLFDSLILEKEHNEHLEVTNKLDEGEFEIREKMIENQLKEEES